MKKVSIYFNDKLHVTVVTRMKKNVEKIRNNGKGNNMVIIKTITKFSIDYRQSDLSSNSVRVMFVIGSVMGHLRGQLTGHACVSGQNASCARAFVSHYAELTVFSSFMKAYNRYLVSFSNFVIVLINS